MRLFIDSNVLVDYWFKRDGKRTAELWYVHASQVLSAHVEKFTSSYSIAHLENEIMNNIGLRENFLLAVNNLVRDFNLRIINVNEQHKKKARQLMRQNNITARHFFEDFVNIALALEKKAIFITRDYELFEKAGGLLKIVSPQDFRGDL